MLHLPRQANLTFLTLEVHILKRFYHPNIVQMHSSHTVDSTSLWIVLEFMDAGTLEKKTVRIDRINSVMSINEFFHLKTIGTRNSYDFKVGPVGTGIYA